jgi:hypothetical protein
VVFFEGAIVSVWCVVEVVVAVSSTVPTCAGFGVVIFGDESLRSALQLPDAVSAISLRAGSLFARHLVWSLVASITLNDFALYIASNVVMRYRSFAEQCHVTSALPSSIFTLCKVNIIDIMYSQVRPRDSHPCNR